MRPLRFRARGKGVAAAEEEVFEDGIVKQCLEDTAHKASATQIVETTEAMRGMSNKAGLCKERPGEEGGTEGGWSAEEAAGIAGTGLGPHNPGQIKLHVVDVVTAQKAENPPASIPSFHSSWSVGRNPEKMVRDQEMLFDMLVPATCSVAALQAIQHVFPFLHHPVDHTAFLPSDPGATCSSIAAILASSVIGGRGGGSVLAAGTNDPCLGNRALRRPVRGVLQEYEAISKR